MADEAAKRRELRRRKILENAEERKKKIFGATSPTSGLTSTNGPQKLEESPSISEASVTPALPETSPPSASLPTPSSNPTSNRPVDEPPESNSDSRGFTYTDLGQSRLSSGIGAQNGSVPDLREQLINLNRLLAANGSLGAGGVQSGSGQEDITHHTSPVKALKSSLVPIFIALLVCILLSNSLGYVVSNSISVPFLVWEIHHLWSQRNIIISSSRSGSGLLGMALMLCGVKQATISSYALIITIGKCFLEDFALYIFTVILWHNIIGLPVQEAEPAEAAQPDMPKEDFWGHADFTNTVEDF